MADVASQAEQMASDSSDPYSTDPARHKAIIINSKLEFLHFYEDDLKSIIYITFPSLILVLSC